MNRNRIKNILGGLPYTVELYWHMVQRHKDWHAHYDLSFLEAALAQSVEEALSFRQQREAGKNVFIFTSLHYWIEFSALLAVVLAAKGHHVTFSFLPYAEWDQPIPKFELRSQNLYTRQVLSSANPLLRVQSLLEVKPPSKSLPKELIRAVEEVSIFDAQYTLQVEDITKEEEVYKLRYQRNLEAAQKARTWLTAHKSDVVIVPNGTIQEMGVVYRVARHLKIPAVTFEFGDQRERIWIGQDSEIMQHETGDLWKAKGEKPLDDDQVKRLQELYAARVNAKTWKNFTRKWQEIPTQGGKAIREKLKLDDRPVVLLATNVLGDSLTLGRQVFSKNMAEWIERTVTHFAQHDEIQLVIRVHPGETLTHGTSMVDIVRAQFEDIPKHIHMIEPEEKINTYDILDITDLGLVYTTTVGLEMAMRGIPVIVAGQTHYRDRGFTCDPETWEAYFSTLNALIADLEHARLNQEQVELAWRYAYLFFFNFPKAFPWHLLDLEEDFNNRPISFVLGEEGHQRYDETFDNLVGKPLTW